MRDKKNLCFLERITKALLNFRHPVYGITSFNIYFILSFQVFHDMANFVRSESIVSLNCCKDSEVIDIPRCYYTRWAGEDNVKEDLIILENLYPQVKIHKISFNTIFSYKSFLNFDFILNLFYRHICKNHRLLNM